MVNLADGSTWDETTPTLSDNRRDGAQEILGLRVGTAIRIDKEHEALNGAATPADGGEHSPGSAKAYRSDADPTNRPNAGALLSAADNGRLYVDSSGATETMKVYIHPSFVAVTGVQIATGTITGASLQTLMTQTATVGFAVDLFIILVEIAAGAAHNTFVVPLKDDAGPFAGITEGTANTDLKMTFERVGTDVEVTKDSGAAVPSGNAQWMAFNFG